MSPPPGSAPPVVGDARARILRQARTHFFTQGYSRFTMDDLAAELGMSKKTLYRHFAGKDEIMGAVIREFSHDVRSTAEEILQNRALNFPEKLRAFVEGMVQRLSALRPHTIRDLERYAP